MRRFDIHPRYFWSILLFLLLPVKQLWAFQTNGGGTVLPGTEPLTFEGNLSYHLLDQAHAFVEKQIQTTADLRPLRWKPDLSSADRLRTSLEPNRERLKFILGLGHDDTQPPHNNTAWPQWTRPVRLEKFSATDEPDLVAETPLYTVLQVRWPALERVYGEGLWVRPKGTPIASVVLLPDADQTPEQLMGLQSGVATDSQMARILAENGIELIIPTLIDRQLLFPDKDYRQSRREWIYRQAFHMGRHIIGYEIEKVRAAIDWFEHTHGPSHKIGIAGYLEGGLLAFYTAALDTRVDATLVSGYFGDRNQAWAQPIYRNIWDLVSGFGDAEVAGLIAPGALVVEYSHVPEILDGPRPDSANLYRHSGYKGRIQLSDFGPVKQEFDRIKGYVPDRMQPRVLVSGPQNRAVPFGSEEALRRFMGFLGVTDMTFSAYSHPLDLRRSFDPEKRQLRQLQELNDHVQWLMRVSDSERNRFFLHKLQPDWAVKPWSTRSFHPYEDPQSFIKGTNTYRDYFEQNIIGSFSEPLKPPHPRSRKTYDTKLWDGYEVLLDVHEGLSAAGVILIPKGLNRNEKRPVVVLQHGRNGIPAHVIEGNTSYYNMAAVLADRGFVVFVPYGLYNGEDQYRWLNRKANSIGKTLFSFVLSQHRQILAWLKTQPFVDAGRIAFYGKSYGGEMAMRIPAILEDYCLSVCSGDFGDWTRKVTDTYFPRSFMHSFEWEMPYFNMGSTFSYAEMAYLIFPRPFMVERGRHDTVQPDEWVAYEYAKVSHLYDVFGLKDRTEIEFFNGGHASRNDGVIRFLQKQLRWP